MNEVGLLLLHLKAKGLPMPEVEYRFHPKRRWRFDLAWPDRLVAVEVDGGVWVGGRHTSGAGFTKDLEKLNAAVEAFWRVFRFTPGMVRSGEAVRMLGRVLG